MQQDMPRGGFLVIPRLYFFDNGWMKPRKYACPDLMCFKHQRGIFISRWKPL